MCTRAIRTPARAIVGMYRMQVYDDRTTGMHWQVHKVGARHGKRYYETRRTHAGGGDARRRSGLHLRRDRAVARRARTKFSSPVSCARNRSNWSSAKRSISKCRPMSISCSKVTCSPARRDRKGRSAITPASTRRSKITRSFISPRSPIGAMRFIRPRSSAFRRWRISTSATPACGFSCRSSK